MTVEPTSSHAYGALTAAGADLTQRQIVENTFRQHGPLAEFEVGQYQPRMKLTSFRARRRELNQTEVIGIMSYTKIDPESGQEVQVWGLIKEHGAKVYYPQDTIAVRLLGETITYKFDEAELITSSADYLGMIVKAAVMDIQERIRNADTRRQSQSTNQQGIEGSTRV